jgi:hypothetical protein
MALIVGLKTIIAHAKTLEARKVNISKDTIKKKKKVKFPLILMLE